MVYCKTILVLSQPGCHVNRPPMVAFDIVGRNEEQSYSVMGKTLLLDFNEECSLGVI